MLVIACVGILGWLLMLGIALGLAAAAKRGDELENDAQRYLPDSHTGAEVIPFKRDPGDTTSGNRRRRGHLRSCARSSG